MFIIAKIVNYTVAIMKWRTIHKRKKIGLALLEEERTQEIATAGLKQLFESSELEVQIEETKDETKPMTNEFVFMTQGGLEVTRVKDLKELLEVIWNVPRSSVIHQINNGDFPRWFDALGHRELAENVRNIKGDHKVLINRLVKACNSALAQEQQVEEKELEF